MNKNSSGQFNSQGNINDSEISALDIFIFLMRWYKLIIFFGLLGVVASLGYFLTIPKQYQASAQIRMAQISSLTSSANPLGLIEDSALIISRFSYPTSYTDEVTKLCGLDPVKDAKVILSKSVKLTAVKGLLNVVELKIIGTSPEATISCAQAVFDLIKTSQTNAIKPYIEELNLKLIDYESRLSKERKLLEIIDKSEPYAPVFYQLRFEDIRFLLSEINYLKKVVSLTETMETRLVAPIYAEDDPNAPIKRNVLLAGLFIGLFLGLLIAFACQILPSFSTELMKKNISK
jgi:hypothetical protein